MLRPFVSRFVLPLVRGGLLHVGRPLDLRAVSALVRTSAASFADGDGEAEAARELSARRTAAGRSLLADLPPPPLDEATLRLGAAVHNLLLLAHPGLGDQVGDRTRARIAESAFALADIGPPGDAEEAVRRHTLLARVPEIIQPEWVVSYWLGRQRFVGRPPPARVLSLPRLRRVELEETRREWLREVGIAPGGRPAWAALQRSSPLGEAFDPLRLEPPMAFSRVLPVLRFPAIARLVADRILALGLTAAGSGLAGAIFRYTAVRDLGGLGGPTPEGVGFGVRFLAHTVWLSLLFGSPGVEENGGDLAAMLVAAEEVDRRLVLPPDVDANSDLGRRFFAALQTWRNDRVLQSARYGMALDTCRYASKAREAYLTARAGMTSDHL